MKNLRILKIPLALLLLLSLGSLQSLCAPWAPMAASLTCGVEAAPGNCSNANLQAECCCLQESTETPSMVLALVAEYNSVPIVQAEQSVVAALPLAYVAPLSRQAHKPKSHRRLFQFHCSFLI